MTKYLLAGLALVLILVIVNWAGLFPQSAPEATRRPPTSVTVAKARIDTLYDRVEALGTTLANESVNITANVTETIAAIHFDDGQFLEQGDLIATLAQNEEEAQRAAAREQLAEHRRELRRLEGLIKTRAEAQRAYDERKTLFGITLERIKEIQARLEDRTIRAPFAGVVGLRRISVGALVEPGDVITTIDDMSRIKLDFAVPATFLSVLKEGSPIRAFSTALGNKVFEGTVTKIDSRVDPQTRSVVVRAALPNPDYELKPGLLMKVVLLKNKRQALMIPEDALVPQQTRHFVLVVALNGDNTVERRQVTIGNRRPGEVEILDGLAAGELVIVRGTTRVRPGDEVKIVEIWEAGVS